MTKCLTVSVVVPVYNASSTIEELSERIIQTLKGSSSTFELILVDDGSIDNSWYLITQLSNKHKGIIKGIRLAKNIGQHNSTICGFNIAKYDYVITIDDDLQYDPESTAILIKTIQQCDADIIYGIPETLLTPRSYLSEIWKFSAKHLNNSIGEGSSFRILKSDLAKQIASHEHSYIFIDEALKGYTSNINFIKVPHRVRRSGKSGYSNYNLLLLALRTISIYAILPVKIIKTTGSILTTLSLILLLFFESSISTTLTRTCLIVLITGILFLFLSFIFELKRTTYLSRKHDYKQVIAEFTE